MRTSSTPNFEIEQSLGKRVIGVDEAGRGPLAGPVVAAAIILDETASNLGINDSKKLSEKRRLTIFEHLTSNYDYSVSIVDANEIDEINILQATFKAMRECISKLDQHKPPIIIDGNFSPIRDPRAIPIIKGDSKSLTIAAASIIAKVVRDNIMLNLDHQYPQYLWQKNKGYGTKEHIDLIRKYGPTSYHRQSFLKNILS
jgi:ribonuclease HII